MPQPVPTAAELRAMFVWTIRKWGKQMTPEELADALITCPTCADIIAAARSAPAGGRIGPVHAWK